MLQRQRLLTPGPTPIPTEVRLAMAGEMIHHRKSVFKEVLHKVRGQLQILFGSSLPVLPLSCSGTGAMTAAVFCLFAPGETVLVAEAGFFGRRWREIAESRGLNVVSFSADWGRAIDPGAVKKILDEQPAIRGVLIQLSETSTGVLHPVEEIARFTRQRDMLLLVDGISAVGISPCPMDAWGIDCLLTGSQKGLMCPPGLSLIALSPRAWEKAAAVPDGCFYFNLIKERENLEKDQTYFTSPVSLILGLQASLDRMLSYGLEAVYRKQWALTMMARTGIRSLGLQAFAPTQYTWGLTSVRLPVGVDGAEILRRMAQDYGVIMAGGQEQLKGRIVRIGHMGWVDWADLAAGIHALAEALRACNGYTAAHDYLESSLAAYRAALTGLPGMEPDLPGIRA
ncbi:MAG: alanine--glyoxylate aminotransferase family protein [Desulfovibrionaceae bacterium]|nr:alanine--glyoxylate aminotransferase family protein [Desulfovibrionaceae bacterium]